MNNTQLKATPMNKRAAIYARVSTDGQTTDNQVVALKDIADRSGWEVVEVFIDHGISGAKSRDERPAFDQLCKALMKREIDVVMTWSVDRLGRSLQGLVEFLGNLQGVKADLYLHQQGIDTTTPAGRAMFQMLGVFSEFERALIQERVRAGLDRARRNGTKLGRPRTSSTKEEAIHEALASGTKGIRKIAKEFGVGVSVVQRIKAEHNAA